MNNVYVAELDKEIVAPSEWSYNAIRIFADKYLAPQDKDNIQNAIHRVATGVSGGDTNLRDYISYGLWQQRFAFNSPVFFNVGVEEDPQCHACFIQSVDDTMDSILDLAIKEGQLFKYGSGTGTNLSSIRGSGEKITGGGVPSGPVSFMKVYDSVAGTVKSGGKTRRAAKMQVLDIDHPDVEEFIWCKAAEEKKANVLIQAGYDSRYDGEAYGSVAFQNANLSVRVTDDFMDAASLGGPWELTARTTGRTLRTVDAKNLLNQMAEAAWYCGDPGIQFGDTINEWNTCPEFGEITSTNPCSEYVFLPETACNLASVNLCSYLDCNNYFNVHLLVNDVSDLVRAMDNIIDIAGYPTEEIAERSRKFRTLGIGYTNLGLLLSKMGLPYDSMAARNMAASITALIHFTASRASTSLAKERGAYEAYSAQDHLKVHYAHASQLPLQTDEEIWEEARRQYVYSTEEARKYGFRNAQLTCIAPTGTISFIMDCVTTGIEPLFARKMTKQLAGGGTLELEFDGPDVRTADEVAPVDHLRMMAACQPFLSGAISKTINMPNSATTEDIEEVYRTAWSLGLKAVAIYRDGCKSSQPLTTEPATEDLQQNCSARRPLPATRQAITHRFSVAGHDGYVTVGLYEDGTPGEVFVQTAKEGSTISGLLDSWAITVSIALQHGVPLNRLLDKLSFVRFEPSGVTSNSDIPMAHSIVDYIARWLLLEFNNGKKTITNEAEPQLDEEQVCPDCGSMMHRTGTCYTCATCGFAGGCG